MATTSEPGLPHPADPEFDHTKLDRLLSESGMDVVLATSKHNVRYLLGAYSRFFAHFEAVALDRILPTVGYVCERLDQAFVACSPQEGQEFALDNPWVPTVAASNWTTASTAASVAALLAERNLDRGIIGIEESFTPLRFHRALATAVPHATFVDAGPLLEELRAVKRPDELELLRIVSEQIVASMHATMHAVPLGSTTRAIHDRLAAEEVARGVGFEYCLVAAGTSLNRTPSSSRWEEGDILSLDSGGTLHGYLGDLTRMAVLGEPTAQMREALAEVEAVQQAARGAIRAGVTGRELYEAALAAQATLPDADRIAFLAHGLGLVTHEAPRMTSAAFIPYPAAHIDAPLEAGMVVSVETDLKLPHLGLVKLEDTLAVTDDGYEAYGDTLRDWSVVTR